MILTLKLATAHDVESAPSLMTHMEGGLTNDLDTLVLLAQHVLNGHLDL